MQNYKIIAGGVPQFSILIFAFCILNMQRCTIINFALLPSREQV